MSYPESQTSNSAIAFGGALMLTGLAAVVVATGASHDSRTFILGGLLLVGGVVRLTTALAADARRRREHPVDPDDPRWHDGIRVVQLAGKTGVDCGRRIIFGTDGVSCDVCHAPAHVDCAEHHLAQVHGPEVAFPFR